MRIFVVVFHFIFLATIAFAETPFVNVRFVPLTSEEGYRSKKGELKQRGEALSDRREYWDDDGFAQFFVVFLGYDLIGPGDKITIELSGATGKLGSCQMVIPAKDPSQKVSFLLRTDLLKPGEYTVHAVLSKIDDVIEAKPCKFARIHRSHPKVPIPTNGISIVTQPQAFLADTVWPISTGIPMPFGALRDPSRLVLLEDGKPVPAQWIPRATWTPGESAPIKWLGLDFLARYESGKPREYPGFPCGFRQKRFFAVGAFSHR